MDIGRNDPCPCGSGKKFKRCCGAVSLTDPMETAATAWRAVQDAVEPKVLRFLRQVAGESAMAKASDDFGLAHPGVHADGPEAQLFLPWLLYDWPAETDSFARRYLVEQGHRLDEWERRFLEAASSAPTSYHEVLAVEPGRSLRMNDVILGTEATLFERSGSQYLHEGDLMYARVVAFEDVALIVGSGSLVIPPIEKGTVLDLKGSLRRSFRSLSADLLRRVEPQLREYYFVIRERLLNPKRPEMRNTDGDPMEFHALSYRVDSAEAAFDALHHLAVGASREELLRDATLRPDGRLRSVTFSWSKLGNKLHASWDNTVLGTVAITEQELRIEVNSAKRAKRIGAEVRKRLGDRAIFLTDETKSIDGMLLETKKACEDTGRQAGAPRARTFREPPRSSGCHAGCLGEALGDVDRRKGPGTRWKDAEDSDA